MIALRVNAEEISLHDVLAGAKFRGDLDFIRQTVDAALIRAAAGQQGIAVSDEELQQAADDFRAARKLYAAQATHAWLAAHHLDQEDWELQLEDQILRQKVRRAVVEPQVDQHFAENRLAFDAATVGWIVIPEESVARELRAQCVEDRVPFHQVAQQFPAGRFAGKRRRSEMERLVAAAVLGASSGEVAGPVRTEQGWVLVLVEAIHPAKLDDETREQIAEALFTDWLEQRRRDAKIELPLLTEL